MQGEGSPAGRRSDHKQGGRDYQYQQQADSHAHVLPRGNRQQQLDGRQHTGHQEQQQQQEWEQYEQQEHKPQQHDQGQGADPNGSNCHTDMALATHEPYSDGLTQSPHVELRQACKHTVAVSRQWLGGCNSKTAVQTAGTAARAIAAGHHTPMARC